MTVRGPAPELAELQFISTLPIDLSFLKEPTVIATDLDFKNLHLALKDAVPILADIQISPKTLTRTFSGIPVITDSPNAKISPSQVTLAIKFPWPLVQTLKPEDLKARVETRNLAPGRHRLNVAADLPDGVSLSYAPAPPASPLPYPGRHNHPGVLSPRRHRPGGADALACAGAGQSLRLQKLLFECNSVFLVRPPGWQLEAFIGNTKSFFRFGTCSKNQIPP